MLMESNNRLLALDAMRGLTIALMIMVNNGLWGAPIFEPLHHATWNGLTAADLVFPFFVFIMGVSISFSLKRFNYHANGQVIAKILKRTILIFLVGIALDFIEKGISGVISGLDFSSIRIPGVLPRLAVSYGAASLLAIIFSERSLIKIIAIFLTAYGIILLTCNGYEPSSNNIVARIDIALFGESHIYHDWLPERTAFDPEGLLGCIPSVAHTLIGFLCGKMLLRTESNYSRVCNLLLIGSVLAISGFLLNSGLPINKKIWSPTFVLTTTGMGAQLLGLMIWMIDIKKHKALLPAVTVFGVNPLALYVFSGILESTLWRITIGSQPLPHAFYTAVAPLLPTGSALPSLIWSLGVTLLVWAVGYPLWRRKIYIKL